MRKDSYGILKLNFSLSELQNETRITLAQAKEQKRDDLVYFITKNTSITKRIIADVTMNNGEHQLYYFSCNVQGNQFVAYVDAYGTAVSLQCNSGVDCYISWHEGE